MSEKGNPMTEPLTEDVPVLRLTGEQLASIEPPIEDDWAVDWDEYEEFVRVSDAARQSPSVDALAEAERAIRRELRVENPDSVVWFDSPEQHAERILARLSPAPAGEGTEPDDADETALALLDQPLSSVTEDGDHDHTGVPCRTCVVMAASVTVEDIERALPYGDFDRGPDEGFLSWRRRFAEYLHGRLARAPRSLTDPFCRECGSPTCIARSDCRPAPEAGDLRAACQRCGPYAPCPEHDEWESVS